MNRLNCIGVIFAVATGLFSCKGYRPELMAFDSIERLGDFPATIDNPPFSSSGLEIPGFQTFYLCDSLFIIASSNNQAQLMIYEYPSFKLLWKGLPKGRGPEDGIDYPDLHGGSLVKLAEGQYALVYSDLTKQLVRVNISVSGDNVNVHKDIILDNYQGMLYKAFQLGRSDTIFARGSNWANTYYDRYLLIDDTMKVVTASMELLNKSVDLHTDDDYYSIESRIAYHPGRDRVVEFPAMTNIINIYSLRSDAFRKSISIEDTPVGLGKIGRTSKGRGTYNFYQCRGFDNCVAAMYIGATQAKWLSPGGAGASIQFFSWEGDPLLSVRIDRDIVYFDVDFARNRILARDYETDELLIFDVDLSVIP